MKGVSARRWRVLAVEGQIIILDTHAQFAVSKGLASDLPFLCIERRSGRVTEGRKPAAEVQSWYDKHTRRPEAHELCVYAILGALSAETASGLLVVTEASCVCEVEGKTVFEVDAVECVTLSVTDKLCDGVLELLNSKGFYFSHDFDITHTLQWKKRKVLDSKRTGNDNLPRHPDGSVNLVDCAEKRFVWNQKLIDQMKEQDKISASWFVPLMQGFISSDQHREEHPDATGWAVYVTVLLISRRGSGRAGTRYNARGLGDNGEVGNLVETEQLVRFSMVDEGVNSGPKPNCPTGWYSFVQLRGSVPLFWEQSPQGPVNFTRAPDQASAPAFQRYQHASQEIYEGELFYVSLLSKDSQPELQLTEALEGQLLGNETKMGMGASRMMQKRPYCHFDFHERVKAATASQFDKELKVLWRDLDDFMERSGYLDCTWETVESTEPRRWQKGVLRTSCLDCLDRTNVVQCMVAWRWLHKILSQYPSLQGFLKPDPMDDSEESSLDLMADGLKSAGASLLSSGASLLGGWGLTSSSSTKSKNDDLLSNWSPEKDKEKPPGQPLLRRLLQNQWADQGDRISYQYTGAGSSMSGMLRRGSASSYYGLEKGLQGIHRAYNASFADAQRQECIDFLLGKHRVNVDLPALKGMKNAAAPKKNRSPIGNLSVWVGSWNVGGKDESWNSPSEMAGLGEWIGPDTVDVAVFCLQEVIELSASNVLLLPQGDDAINEQFEAVAQRALASHGTYAKVRSVSMVGLLCVVFVRAPLLPFVKDVRATRVQSGSYGATGNKGAVALRFEIFSTSICFICAHLESGTDKVEQRLTQMKEALKCFDGAHPPIPSAADHDVFALAGDLNTRLSLPTNMESGEKLHKTLAGSWVEAASPSFSSSVPAWKSLFRYDQFSTGMAVHLRQMGIQENPVTFPPTYRLIRGADEFDAKREPAWCDRVLYKSMGARVLRYRAVPTLKKSDHRAVCASLEAPLLGNVDERGAFEVVTKGGQNSMAPVQGGYPTMSSVAPRAPPDLMNFTASFEPVKSAPQQPAATTAPPDLIDLQAPPPPQDLLA